MLISPLFFVYIKGLKSVMLLRLNPTIRIWSAKEGTHINGLLCDIIKKMKMEGGIP